MTISVSPGLDIRIPNHQLILPDYSFNAQGFLTEPDPTTRVLLINSLDGENANDMPVLGRPFLSSSYLFVDQDHAQFALWSGNPTAEKNIIPIGDAATCSPDVGTTTPSSTAPVPAPAPASKNPNADQNINTGGIAGVVVGSLAGIVIVSLLFFRYYRQHRQHRSRQSRKANITKAEKEDLRLSASYLSFKPEMPTDRQPPQELPVERNPGYAVTPYEMAVEPHEMAAGSAGGSLKQGKRDHRAPGERKGKERQGRTERL